MASVTGAPAGTRHGRPSRPGRAAMNRFTCPVSGSRGGGAAAPPPRITNGWRSAEFVAVGAGGTAGLRPGAPHLLAQSGGPGDEAWRGPSPLAAWPGARRGAPGHAWAPLAAWRATRSVV